MKNIEGFELIYPDGCKEVNDSLKSDELKKRLTDIMRSLEEHSNDRNFNTDTLLDNTDANISENSNLKMKGLLMHFTSEMFLDHEDIDVQLRVAVCISNIIKLYCPDNPLISFADSKTRIKTVLIFLLKCINEMSKLKSKSDKHFLNLYKIFSIGCQTNLFQWFTLSEESDTVFLEFIRISFNIVRKFPLWSDDNKPMQMLSDSFITIINSPGVVIPDASISFLLNFLADRCATKEQKHLSIEIISRCITKLEDQIQTILQNQLGRNDIEDTISESSDNEVADEPEDDFCSMAEYQLVRKYKPEAPKPEKQKPKPKKLGKNTIESCVEYTCDHTFQIIYELFKIGESIIIPLLPSIEMKLRSPNNVTDRKRACRLLGKLFATFTLINSNSQLSLWESFIGRFCDIELEVREICVRVASDVLNRILSAGDDASGGLIGLPSCQDDLVKALQKRSHDQEETIRYQLVRAVSHMFVTSPAIVRPDPLDPVNEILLKILLDRTRDKSSLVRKEANASLGKLYRRILTTTTELRDAQSIRFGVDQMAEALKIRLETLMVHILRLYLRNEVEDKIIVERLFHTYLVPYHFDAAARMRALLECFTVSDEPSLMSLQEMFKTQVMILNVMRDTVALIKESNSEKVLSPSVSQKMKEKVKRLAEFVPYKDKVESLTKFFVLIRADKKLFGFVSKLVSPDSSRDAIVKSISDIKKHLSAPTSKTSNAEANPTNIQKKKAFKNTIKCLLERCAPIIMDLESGQELLCFLVSTNEAIESSKSSSDYSKSIYRALKLLHAISIIYRNSVPTQDAYCFIASIISRFQVPEFDRPTIEPVLTCLINDKQESTPSSTLSIKSQITSQKNIPNSVEELCLLILARIINFRSSYEQPTDSNTEEDSAKDSTSIPEHWKPVGLFTGESDQFLDQTRQVLTYLSTCATNGSIQKHVVEDKLSSIIKSNGAIDQDGDREYCIWKYNARVAKLATRCLIGLYFCCQLESRGESSELVTEILAELETRLDELMKSCEDCPLFSPKQTIVLSTLSQLGLHMRRRYGTQIHSYVQHTLLMRILTEESDSGHQMGSPDPVTVARNLSSWVSNSSMSVASQVRVQSLKMLSKWMVTLRVEDDRNLILSVMVCLRKYIGSYGNPEYTGPLMDGDMAQMRLAAGKCWLRLAQVQSFLSIFDVKWLHRLSSLIYDPCVQVRDGFLRKLHKGLFRLQLPLDYMAMFAFVPLVSSPEFLVTAKNFFSANVTRRREFLDRNPHYLTDAKLLFAVLPEYVLAFIIHMLAHDSHWTDVDEPASINRVKQCLWFVMEPILKLNENSSFIRKLLEKIKHAQDASEPTNDAVNEKLYICCDIALGLLISKQASYDLKEYPVELRLPRTRYVPAPHMFFNPDFANILLENPARVRVQFSPTHKSKQMIMNFMPAPLIKGHPLGVSGATTAALTVSGTASPSAAAAATATGPITGDEDAASAAVQAEQEIVVVHTASAAAAANHHQFQQQPIRSISMSSSKPKKHVARIVVGLPEMESENVPTQSVSVPDPISTSRTARNVRKTRLGPANDSVEQRSPKKRRRRRRSESPVVEDDADLLQHLQGSGSPLPAGSVTKHGRIVRPNTRVMKDMVSLATIPTAVRKSPVNTAVTMMTGQSNSVIGGAAPPADTIMCPIPLNSTVSVSIPRMTLTPSLINLNTDTSAGSDTVAEEQQISEVNGDDGACKAVSGPSPTPAVISPKKQVKAKRAQSINKRAPPPPQQKKAMLRQQAQEQPAPPIIDIETSKGDTTAARNWRHSVRTAPVTKDDPTPTRPTRSSSRRPQPTEIFPPAAKQAPQPTERTAAQPTRKAAVAASPPQSILLNQLTRNVLTRRALSTRGVIDHHHHQSNTNSAAAASAEPLTGDPSADRDPAAVQINKEQQQQQPVTTRKKPATKTIPPTSISGTEPASIEARKQPTAAGTRSCTTRPQSVLQAPESIKMPSPRMPPVAKSKRAAPKAAERTPETISAAAISKKNAQKLRAALSPVSTTTSPIRSAKSSVSSPLDIVCRSKRVASQTATEQLVTKRSRNV